MVLQRLEDTFSEDFQTNSSDLQIISATKIIQLFKRKKNIGNKKKAQTEGCAVY